MRYNIFISYRQESGKQYARTLQLILEKKGYSVFLDYDELKDDVFAPQIEESINNSDVFLLVLSKGVLQRCENKKDWVRHELEIALENNKKIIPVNPDKTFDGIPENTPEHIRNAIESIQHSDIYFGQALNATVDLLIKNRIAPHVKAGVRKHWRVDAIIMALLLLIFAGIFVVKNSTHKELEQLKREIKFQGENLDWHPEITQSELLAIQQILDSLQKIEGGTFIQGAHPRADGSYEDLVQTVFETPAFETKVNSFYISKYEVTIGQWNAIMHDNRRGDPGEPIANVTYYDALKFINRLKDLTCFLFRLPTESEWEYAAKGGANPEEFLFAGSNNLKDVAWYSANSGGKAHSKLCAVPTNADLFNMSGNVSEWCDTPFILYDKNSDLDYGNTKVIRGGNFDSEPYELTVTHREPTPPDTSIPTLGFRLALDHQ